MNRLGAEVDVHGAPTHHEPERSVGDLPPVALERSSYDGVEEVSRGHRAAPYHARRGQGANSQQITTVLAAPLTQTGMAAYFAISGGGFVTGVALLIVGLGKRAKYNEWLKAHPVVSGFGVFPIGTSSGGMSWSGSF